MKRIKTASDLKLFLEAVAKESTLKAKNILSEDLEQEIEYVSRGLENAKKNQSGYSKYMQIFEVEDEDESKEKEPSASDSEEKDKESELSSDMKDSPRKEKPKNKAVITIPLVEDEPKFEDIVKAVGWVRAGPSIKEKPKRSFKNILINLMNLKRKHFILCFLLWQIFFIKKFQAIKVKILKIHL